MYWKSPSYNTDLININIWNTELWKVLQFYSLLEVMPFE